MTPTTIDRYELREIIGRGGMATVFYGYDPRFRRAVAIKVMTHDFTGDEVLRARFEREAQTIAALEHPAIVPVYDFGEEQGRPYLVMRLMNGGTLADRLQKGAIPIEETAQILRRIGSALERAHQKGIIHRDLKPSNIMFDEYGDAFLGDFGIARLAESAVTLTGEAVVGTPAYMSPEQVNGEKELDGRSDIYALGVICFEMLTGQRPFQGDTAARLMMKHLLDPAPDIRLMRPDLPPGVETVIARTLAKKPDERFASAGEMTDTLARLLQQRETPTVPKGPPAAASPPPPTPPAITPLTAPASTDSPTEITPPITETEIMHPTFPTPPLAASRPLPRGWLIAGLIGLLVVLIGGGLLLSSVLNGDGAENGGGSSENERIPAAAENEEAAAPAAPSRTLSPSRTPRPTATTDPYPEAEVHMDRFYDYLEQDEFLAALREVNLALEIVEDPWYRHEQAYVYFRLGEVETALEHINALIAVEPENPEHYILRGMIYRETNQVNKAVADHIRAVELDPGNGYYHHELASSYRTANELENAIAEWDTAIRLYQDDIWYYVGQAEAYVVMGDMEHALMRYNDAAARFPNSSYIYDARGEFYMWQMWDQEAALADLNHALELDPENAGIYARLGQLHLYFFEDLQTALTFFNQAMALDAAQGWFYADRGICYRNLGDYEAALADFEQMSVLEPDNPRPYEEQGWVFQNYLNQPEEALVLFDKALALDPEAVDAYVGRGHALRALGRDPDEVLAAWNSCVMYDPYHYWCYWDLAELYRELGLVDEANANYHLFLEYVDEADCPDCQEAAQSYLDNHGG